MRTSPLLLALVLTGCGDPASTGSSTQTQPGDPDAVAEAPHAAGGDETDWSVIDAVTVKQDPKKMVMWVLPGPRELDPAVFGTPEAPKATVDPKAAPEPVRDVLKAVPILVGVPEEARGTTEDGSAYTATKVPTPFSDKAASVSGSFEATFHDETNEDAGEPMDTMDTLALTAGFTDPDGASYSIRNVKVVQPPLPGYETDGGVLLNNTHHGSTGTGTPLMPEVYTYAAAWFVGDLVKNDEVIATKQMMHLMTTQNVRTKDYALAIGKELPLDPANTAGQQAHHTHLVILPVTATPDGPDPAPLKSAYTLPNGEPQPFIHVMYEQDTIADGPAFVLPDAG